jgi:hypothetical protein
MTESKKPSGLPPTSRFHRQKPPAAKKPGSEQAYEVGYGKPPKKTRWSKGESGNAAGPRPKSEKPARRRGERPQLLPPASLAIDEVLNQKVWIMVGGKRRRVTTFQMLMMQLVKQAAEGDAGARRELFRYAKQFNYQPPPMGLDTALQGWVQTGEMPDPALAWMINTDRLAEAMRAAGLLDASEIGGLTIPEETVELLANAPMTSRQRRALRRALRYFKKGVGGGSLGAPPEAEDGPDA